MHVSGRCLSLKAIFDDLAQADASLYVGINQLSCDIQQYLPAVELLNEEKRFFAFTVKTGPVQSRLS